MDFWTERICNIYLHFNVNILSPKIWYLTLSGFCDIYDFLFKSNTQFSPSGKNAAFLRLIRGRSLAEESEPSLAKANELGLCTSLSIQM